MEKYIVAGKIYCGEGKFAESFLVDGEMIGYVGGLNELKEKYPGVRVEEHAGLVVPGFNDSHMHLLNLGHFLSVADLHVSSMSSLIETLKKFSEEHPDKEVIMGRGWNHDYFSDEVRFPNRYDLDKVSTVKPVVITRTCGHVWCANSKALEMLGIAEAGYAVEGGEIEVSESGVPTGVFKENAVGVIEKILPTYTVEDIKEKISLAMRLLNSYGVTSSQTDDLKTLSGADYRDVLKAYYELAKENKMTVRVNEQVQFTNVESFKEFFDEGHYDNKGDLFFKIGPLKMLGDGSLGARTAFLSRPYADKEDTSGIPVYTQEQFDSMIKMAREHEMPVAIHAIGDGCLDRILNSYEKYLDPDKDHRCGVVHCQITRPEQLLKFKELKLHAYIQSIFLDYDNHIVRDRVGEELASSSYSFKTLNEYTRISNGSDSPVEMPNCLGGIQCAVTRCSLNENNPYNLTEALTVMEALDSFTVNGAYASFEEGFKGRIATGMVADYVVIDKDLFTIDSKDINKAQILETVVAGAKVFTK